MGFFSNFFQSSPSSAQVSDWLTNMNEAFIRMGSDTVKTQDSPDMLTFFTLINSTLLSKKLLDAEPSKITSKIGHVFSESRVYYDCFWQLVLLNQYQAESDQEKISKLSGDVLFRFNNIMSQLFEKNPNVKKCLEISISPKYEQLYHEGIKEYIYGERKNPEFDLDDHTLGNVLALTERLRFKCGFDKSKDRSIAKIIGHETDKASTMKFLTNFDFANFKPLPDKFYK